MLRRRHQPRKWQFEDADWFHPASYVEKMHSGIPLTDEDRAPGLAAVAAWIDKTRAPVNTASSRAQRLSAATVTSLSGIAQTSVLVLSQ
jgi:gluconate kinase